MNQSPFENLNGQKPCDGRLDIIYKSSFFKTLYLSSVMDSLSLYIYDMIYYKDEMKARHH